MIGYYVHHQGMGHAHRALAVAQHLGAGVTGLSSLPAPDGWPGEWIVLQRDDDDGLVEDPDAHGYLHWVPERSSGLRARMAAISAWLDERSPELMVVDVSVEVALLVRLHGVPVVTVVLPGVRTDPAHNLVHGIARRVVAAWPADVHGMLSGPQESDPRLVHVGGMSRFDGRTVGPRAAADPHVTVLLGRGGIDAGVTSAVEDARATTPDWTWTVLGNGSWIPDPWRALCRADVVVTHAGQNAIAEVAAARRPAIIVPQERPFDEQRISAAAIRRDGGLPAVVLESFPASGWSGLLDSAARLNGEQWHRWNDGHGAERFARILQQELAA